METGGANGAPPAATGSPMGLKAPPAAIVDLSRSAEGIATARLVGPGLPSGLCNLPAAINSSRDTGLSLTPFSKPATDSGMNEGLASGANAALPLKYCTPGNSAPGAATSRAGARFTIFWRAGVMSTPEEAPASTDPSLYPGGCSTTRGGS